MDANICKIKVQKQMNGDTSNLSQCRDVVDIGTIESLVRAFQIRPQFVKIETTKRL
jgi:hypothetical protein